MCNCSIFLIMRNDSRKPPEVKMIEVDGVEYQLIDGRLYRYAEQKVWNKDGVQRGKSWL